MSIALSNSSGYPKAAPSIGWADSQPLTKSMMWDHGTARKTMFAPSDAITYNKARNGTYL